MRATVGPQWCVCGTGDVEGGTLSASVPLIIFDRTRACHDSAFNFSEDSAHAQRRL